MPRAVGLGLVVASRRAAVEIDVARVQRPSLRMHGHQCVGLRDAAVLERRPQVEPQVGVAVESRRTRRRARPRRRPAAPRRRCRAVRRPRRRKSTEQSECRTVADVRRGSVAEVADGVDDVGRRPQLARTSQLEVRERPASDVSEASDGRRSRGRMRVPRPPAKHDARHQLSCRASTTDPSWSKPKPTSRRPAAAMAARTRRGSAA